MQTLYASIENGKDNTNAVQQAAAILQRGGLVAIPTETVYGLAANALDEKAVASIFQAKGRPQDNPLIVHVAEVKQIVPLVEQIPQKAKDLFSAFSPGPLTVILPKSDKIPYITSGGLDTVAIRIPSHPAARAIINLAKLPLAAPSANLSGSPSPTSAAHVLQDLNGKIDMIVNAGDCGVGVESTVISLAGAVPRLLRPGFVTAEEIEDVIGTIEIDPAVCHKLANNAQATSPGMKYKHYAPKANITILDGNRKEYLQYIAAHAKEIDACLCFEEDCKAISLACISYGKESSSSSQARGLFAALRKLDEIGAKNVIARCPQKQGVGLAVYNRLLRAAAFSVIKLS